MADLTHARLLAALHYDPETGLFTWKVRASSRAAVGQVAGTLHRYGYIQIKLDGVLYRASRLAWFYVKGEWPKGIVDHRDRVRSNNRWSNLRDVTHGVNNENIGLDSHRNESVGLLGVTLHKASGLFQGQIKVKGRHRSLGYFHDPAKAHEAYIAAKRQLHEGCLL